MPGKHFQYAFDISVAFKNVISEKHARQPVYVGMPLQPWTRDLITVNYYEVYVADLLFEERLELERVVVTPAP